MKLYKFDFWFVKQNINTKHSDIFENLIISKDEEKLNIQK